MPLSILSYQGPGWMVYTVSHPLEDGTWGALDILGEDGVKRPEIRRANVSV